MQASLLQRGHRLTEFVLVLALALGLGAEPSGALSEATFDSADRFPYVVEVKSHGDLICSGTVLYPRLVVTAAHCLQQKAYWRGGQFYIDEYLLSSDVEVSLTREGATGTYEVAAISVSPVWLDLASEPRSRERFGHDIALIVTKEPLTVDLPSIRLDDAGADAPRSEASRYGVLVAFGFGSCVSIDQCGQAGIRRYRAVELEPSADCAKTLRGVPRAAQPRQPVEDGTSSDVWCVDASVMPGDSGGALLVEGDDGRLYYGGVISAQQGPPELTLISPIKRSLATAIFPSAQFILGEARKLGYTP